MDIRQMRVVWLWAALGTLLVGAWQTATVSANFGGDWTALFCTGDRIPVPPQLANETYVFRGSPGYDGQFYRYIAHDPLNRHGAHAFIDAPAMRYRRILLPGLAAILSLGRQEWVDGAYILTTLAFIFAGCYWCGLWAARQGKHPAWGLLFVLVPATLISADRMTVDVAVAALAAGAVVYWDSSQLVRCYLCIAAACLARETGVLLAGGWVLGLSFQRQWSRAVLFATAVIPMAAWFLYVRSALPRAGRGLAVPGWLFHWDSGIVGRMMEPLRYGFAQPLETVVQAADVLSLGGMVVALAVTCVLLLRKRADPPAIAALLHVALFAIVNIKEFWDSVYGYGRPFSAMLVLAALTMPWTGKLRMAVFIAAASMDMRIFLQLGPQGIGIFKAWMKQ